MFFSKFRQLPREFARVRQSSLARNTGWMLMGRGVNLVLQAAYFVLLARALGANEFGIFAGAVALATITTPYSTLGSGMLFMRYVGADSSQFAVYWGNILATTLGIGSLLSFLACFVGQHWLSSTSLSLILLVTIDNCIVYQVLVCIGQMFQAFEQLRVTAALSVMTNFLRVTAVGGMLLLIGHRTATEWALLSLLVSSIATAVGCAIVTQKFGWPRFSLELFGKRAVEGLGFSFAGSTQSVYNDIDKTVLSHYGMTLANGIYTVAYRIVDVATTPIVALDAAALPRFFRKSAGNADNVKPLSFWLARRAACAGLVAAGILFVGATLIPRFLGEDFAGSVPALRWLCLLPFFRGFHQLTGSAITGCGFQRYRTGAQFAAALLNVSLNLWLIPKAGWYGAAWASLAADAFLAIANSLILQTLNLRSVLPRNPTFRRVDTVA
jgi:O-antigen/teichoic acid export membrane protein